MMDPQLLNSSNTKESDEESDEEVTDRQRRQHRERRAGEAGKGSRENITDEGAVERWVTGSVTLTLLWP